MLKEKQTLCPICGEKLPFIKETLKDGVKVCAKHVVNEAGLLLKKDIRNSSVEDIKVKIESVKLARSESPLIEDESLAEVLKDINSSTVCPRCDSTNIQFMQNNKKAFSVGKAVGGAVLTGGVGALAGFAGKKGDDQWHCNQCGNVFTTKKRK